MASSVAKCLFTPAKTPIKNLIPSPFIVKRKSLSPASTKSVRVSSPKLDSSCPLSEKQINSIKLLSDNRSLLKDSGAARCLFSPGKPSRSSQFKEISSPRQGTLCPTPTVPSFNTPHRRCLSPNKLNEKVKGFVLGRGSFGLVVKGTYRSKNVAVKITQDWKQHITLKNEKNALKLKHPNIIKVYQVIESPKRNLGFVFMDLYCNASLENILQQEVLQLVVKLKYLMQIGSALEYCHKNDVLHLDVKPRNVIVNSTDNNCKLCDFGSSTTMGDVKKTDNTTKGTLIYSAPELLRGENPTDKADIYSFGITMWQTVYQDKPYDKEDLQMVVYKVVNQNYRPGSHLVTYNPVVHPIYEACWQANPQQRPSMSQVLTKLEKINGSRDETELII